MQHFELSGADLLKTYIKKLYQNCPKLALHPINSLVLKRMTFSLVTSLTFIAICSPFAAVISFNPNLHGGGCDTPPLVVYRSPLIVEGPKEADFL